MRSLLHKRMVSSLGAFFDKTCTMQQANNSDFDEYGEPVEVWATVSGLENVPCAVGNITAKDHVGMNATLSEIDMLKVMLKGYYPEITGDMRAVIDGLTYNVLSVTATQEHMYTRLIVGRLT